MFLWTENTSVLAQVVVGSKKVTISQDNDNKPLSNKLTVFSQTIIEAMWPIWTEHNENKLLLS